ncbi:MAG: hypothetical protein JSW61_12750 [Candidatus Thorarchaeota archaeon]|nr:MAG: hypothetical protein JSW61_12750 [Candidatus Thorarchaeota archaeon]
MAEGLKWLQCPVCKDSFNWKVPADALKDVKRYPVAVVIKHKDHYLVCYLDSHQQLADTEVAAALIEAEEQ